MITEQVKNVDSIEELFALLKLDFDKHTVNVHRMHILRKFGEIIETIDARDPAPAEDERRLLYTSALLQAHDQYLTGQCSCEPPVFPGLRKDLVTLKRKP